MHVLQYNCLYGPFMCSLSLSFCFFISHHKIVTYSWCEYFSSPNFHMWTTSLVLDVGPGSLGQLHGLLRKTKITYLFLT